MKNQLPARTAPDKIPSFAEKQAARELLGQAPSTLDIIADAMTDPPMPRSALEPQKSNGDKAPPKKGRPTHYTYTNVHKLLKAIMGGMPIATAATLIGLEETEIYQWKSKYPDFSRCLSQGRAILEEALSRTVLGGTAKHPKLALDFLERRFPQNWAPAKNVKHSGFVAYATVGEINLQALAEHRRKKDEINLQPETAEAQQIEADTPHVVVDSCESENRQNESVAIPVEPTVSEQPAEA